MQVDEFLSCSAARLPSQTALVSGSQRLTYAQVERECDRVAVLLRDAGVRHGDRVAIYLDNVVEAVVAAFATLRTGAVFVIVSPAVKAGKLEFMLNNCRATALFCPARRLSTLRAVWNATPHLQTVIMVGRKGDDRPSLSGKTLIDYSATVGAGQARVRQEQPPIDLDLAALVYTSGSTGHPKGVMLTHLNIVSAATSIGAYLRNAEGDVILNVLPLAFTYGLYQVLMAFQVGATVVLERSFTYPHLVLEAVARDRVSGLPIVPTMAATLLQLDLTKYDLTSLRYITNAGAALPTPHIAQLRKLFPHVQLYSMYGLTECARVSYLPPDEIDTRSDSVGKGMPNQEVYLVDEDGRRLAAGVAELVIRGSHVMQGYWELPDETDHVLRDGPLPGERVLFSGDIFRMDEDGYLYFVGRKDDIIKTRGEKVSPKEVENVICSLAGVAEAVVIGTPDPLLGQAVKAIVKVKEESQVTTDDVLRHCREHLDPDRRPHHRLPVHH